MYTEPKCPKCDSNSIETIYYGLNTFRPNCLRCKYIGDSFITKYDALQSWVTEDLERREDKDMYTSPKCPKCDSDNIETIYYGFNTFRPNCLRCKYIGDSFITKYDALQSWVTEDLESDGKKELIKEEKINF